MILMSFQTRFFCCSLGYVGYHESVFFLFCSMKTVAKFEYLSSSWVTDRTELLKSEDETRVVNAYHRKVMPSVPGVRDYLLAIL